MILYISFNIQTQTKLPIKLKSTEELLQVQMMEHDDSPFPFAKHWDSQKRNGCGTMEVFFSLREVIKHNVVVNNVNVGLVSFVVRVRIARISNLFSTFGTRSSVYNVLDPSWEDWLLHCPAGFTYVPVLVFWEFSQKLVLWPLRVIHYPKLCLVSTTETFPKKRDHDSIHAGVITYYLPTDPYACTVQ